MLKHEFLLYLINQPQLLIFAEAIRGFKCLDIPKVGYLVNDAHLATEILMHRNFSSGGHGGMGSLITPFVGEYGLFNMDGENHLHFKRQLMKVFNRDYVTRVMQIAASGLLENFLADLCTGKAVDVVAFTRQFTTRVMLYMFGVDIETLDIATVEPKITQAVNHYMSKLHLTKVMLTEKETLSVNRMIAEVDALIDGNQRADQSDSFLQAVREMGISEREAHGLMYSLLVAGTETTNVSLPRILALLLDTGQYADLKAQPDLMSHAIEEGIRVTTASPMIPRAIETDTDIEGYHFKAGRRALMIVYNMMKQAYDLPNARDFDIRRKIPQTLKHLNFGHGAHFCLGFPLAHGEIEMVLAALLDLPNPPKVLGRGYSRGQTFPAYTKLVIRC